MSERILAVRVATSKRGQLWPTEYWKTLIDAIVRGGAKHDPRSKYPDLSLALSDMVEERNGRFFPRRGRATSTLDDTAIHLIVVSRVGPGREAVSVCFADLPHVDSWSVVRVPYFGTIGNSKYEAQSARNREALSSVFAPVCSHAHLRLAFQLSCARRDRDLDNLADALIPFFNKQIGCLDEITLVKLEPAQADYETLRFCCVP